MKHIYEVFVFCSGKSGSMSLYNTFKNSGFKCLHCHTPHQFKRTRPEIEDSIFEIIETSRKRLEKVYIIDVYRNPIERKLSSFFNNLDFHVCGQNLTLPEIEDTFNENFIYFGEEYHSINIALRYFGQCLFKNFDFENGYNIRIFNNMYFIKLRFKDIMGWDNILYKIFNREMEISNSNKSEDKSYKTLYETAKKTLRIKNQYLEKIGQDREFNVHNRKFEINEYLNKWRNRVIDQ